MAAARRHPGRLQPCRATADHQHAPAHRRRRECSLPPLRFPTRGGVHETGHRLVELDHRDAALVAGDARPDLVEPTGPRLGEQERVSDVSAGHADEVGLPSRQHLFCELEAIEAADGEDGKVGHHCLDPRRQVAEGGAREVHVRHLGGERVVGDVGRVGDVDEVDGDGGGDPRHHPLHVLEPEAGGHELLGADPDADGEVRPHRLAHGLQHRQRESESVLLAAPVGVRADVRGGGEELLQEMAVAEVHLEAVEPRLPQVAGGEDVGGHDRLHVVLVHLVRDRTARRPRNGGRAPGGRAPEVALSVPPDVHDLAEEPRPLGVHGVGDSTEGGDAAGIVADHALRAADAGRMDPDRLEDDEPGAAARLLRVIVDVPVAGQVIDAVVGRVGRHEDPVAQLHRPDAERREHVRES